jgi:hypothetical protein
MLTNRHAFTLHTAAMATQAAKAASAASAGLTGALIVVLLAGAPLRATAADSPQPTRLGSCSKDAKAKGLKGDERKQFVSECASKKKTAGEKPGACSKQAADKGLKGDERSKFLADCAKS